MFGSERIRTTKRIVIGEDGADFHVGGFVGEDAHPCGGCGCESGMILLLDISLTSALLDCYKPLVTSVYMGGGVA